MADLDPAENPARRLRVVLVLSASDGGPSVLPHVDELRSRGHEVVAVLPPGRGSLRAGLTERGIAVVASPFDFRFGLGWSTLRRLFALRRMLRWLRPDVLHYHLYASALAVRLATLGLGVPRVHMVAGPLYLESPVIRAVERVLARLDTVTIGGSERTSIQYRAFGRPPERTPTIPYGVDCDHFRPPDAMGRAVARAELGVELGTDLGADLGTDPGADDTFVAVMVAPVYAPRRAVHRGQGIKGHEVLLAAWRAFHRDHPQSWLVIVGGGFGADGETYRQELMHRHRADPGVSFLGAVPDVRPYFAAADVSVSPSLSDNHGTALEAGAMGVPSIVSDAGALPEAVDPSSGWVVARGSVEELTDALRQATAEFQRGELGLRGKAARDLVERAFDRAVSARRLADVLEWVAPTRDQGPDQSGVSAADGTAGRLDV